MPELYLEWGDDLIITPSGSIQMAFGWDEVRQRIERRLLTTPKGVLPDGTPTPPDYLFDVSYGIGLPKMVGQPITKQALSEIQQAVNQGVMVDDAVSDAQPPNIQLYRLSPSELFLIINVDLVTGEPGQIAISFPG